MEASCREDVFSSLREKGIKAIKVVAEDGSKANGEFHGVRKRVVAIIAFAVALLSSLVVYYLTRQISPTVEQAVIEKETISKANEAGLRIAKPRPRKQLVIPDGVNINSIDTLRRGELILAKFAQPGKIVEDSEIPKSAEEDLRDCLDEDIIINDDDEAWVADLKRILAGLKNEVKMLVSGGKAISGVIEYYKTRQKMEARFKADILKDVERGTRSKEAARHALDAVGL